MNQTSPPPTIARLQHDQHVLLANVRRWNARDRNGPDPEARQAVNGAIAAIDTLTADLHRLRIVLVNAMQRRDEATRARAARICEG